MVKLTEKTEILQMWDVDHRDGVTYSADNRAASTVTIAYARWLDMGRPRRIVVTITPSETMPEPVCTCGPSKHLRTHHLGSESHYVGCPRWGTPLQ